MTRLTNDMREAIAHAAVGHKFDPLKTALGNAEDALAREVHAALLPASEIAAAAALPARWVKATRAIRTNAGGYRVNLELTDDARLPVPVDSEYHGSLGNLPHGDLCDRVRAHVENRENTYRQRMAAYQATKTLLASATTIKSLRAAWPDGETFYKKFEGAVPASTLPAVRVDEVNKLLGLPPE